MAAIAVLVVLVAGEAILVALLVDDLAGHGFIGPAICVVLVLAAVLALRAALRRAPDDRRGARALVVLGAGLTFAAISATALLLAILSIV